MDPNPEHGTPNARRWLIVSDVDGTLLGDDAALAQLSSAIHRRRSRITIVYNSSRPCASQHESLALHADLPRPDYLIGAMGTEIEDIHAGRLLDEYTATLSPTWRHDRLVSLMDAFGFQAHDPKYQTQFKISYDVPLEPQYRAVLARLAEEGLSANVIYSGGKNLDLIPINAGKGRAADYLRARLGYATHQVVVAGDSGNDRAMYDLDFKGIVVANAAGILKRLAYPNVYHARSAYAAGVLEGLRHWKVL